MYFLILKIYYVFKNKKLFFKNTFQKLHQYFPLQKQIK